MWAWVRAKVEMSTPWRIHLKTFNGLTYSFCQSHRTVSFFLHTILLLTIWFFSGIYIVHSDHFPPPPPPLLRFNFFPPTNKFAAVGAQIDAFLRHFPLFHCFSLTYIFFSPADHFPLPLTIVFCIIYIPGSRLRLTGPKPYIRNRIWLIFDAVW